MPKMPHKKLEEGRCDDGSTTSTIDSSSPGVIRDNQIPVALQNTFSKKLDRYNQMKSAIFSTRPFPEKTTKISKCRFRHRRRKFIEKSIDETIIDNSIDFRPYVEVSINGFQMKGMLDSGAQISCLGKDCLDFVRKTNIQYKQIPRLRYVKTASGQSQEIIGYFNARVCFQKKEHTLTLFLIPSLEQTLYLGTDFWAAFEIATHLIPPRISSISTDSSNEETVRDNSCIHNLSYQQKCELEKVKLQFPSYAISGLGRTNVLTHKIDVQGSAPVKAKHYPVSPPIQKLIDSEVDRMIEMKVIEESNSPWNSPVVLVRKPNKYGCV